MQIRFRHVARAVIVRNNRLLIARLKGAHAFLPGGGVDAGEGAHAALQRELKEELGADCTIHRFMGVIETHWLDPHGVLHHEISHLFETASEQLDPNRNPKSLESHLEFEWIELSAESLIAHNVLPASIQESLERLVRRQECAWITNVPTP